MHSCGLSWDICVSARCIEWTEHWPCPLNKDFHIACYLLDTFLGTGYKRKKKHVSFYWYVFAIAERLESNCPPLVPEGERRSGFSNRKEGCGVFIFYFLCLFIWCACMCVCVVSVHTLATVHAGVSRQLIGIGSLLPTTWVPGTELT